VRQQRRASRNGASGRLTLLPEQDDLSDPSNWRGIMLLDEVVAFLGWHACRLAKVGVEYQNGFLRCRVCSDDIFLLKMALLKRKEHGLGTWALCAVRRSGEGV
jgi:hypothetical protein